LGRRWAEHQPDLVRHHGPVSATRPGPRCFTSIAPTTFTCARQRTRSYWLNSCRREMLQNGWPNYTGCTGLSKNRGDEPGGRRLLDATPNPAFANKRRCIGRVVTLAVYRRKRFGHRMVPTGGPPGDTNNRRESPADGACAPTPRRASCGYRWRTDEAAHHQDTVRKNPGQIEIGESPQGSPFRVDPLQSGKPPPNSSHSPKTVASAIEFLFKKLAQKFRYAVAIELPPNAVRNRTLWSVKTLQRIAVGKRDFGGGPHHRPLTPIDNIRANACPHANSELRYGKPPPACLATSYPQKRCCFTDRNRSREVGRSAEIAQTARQSQPGIVRANQNTPRHPIFQTNPQFLWNALASDSASSSWKRGVNDEFASEQGIAPSPAIGASPERGRWGIGRLGPAQFNCWRASPFTEISPRRSNNREFESFGISNVFSWLNRLVREQHRSRMAGSA